ncbi:hypothetical protein VTO73DRAFT_13062 [Trametes versicolor]
MERLIPTMSALAIFAQLELVSIWVAARYTVPGHHVADDAFIDSHSEKTTTDTAISTWAYLDVLRFVRLHISGIQEVALQHEPDVGFYRASAPTLSTDNVLSPRFDGEGLAITSLHLGAKAIAGIVGGSVAVIVLGIVFYLLSRDSRRRRQAMAEANDQGASREECFDDVVRRKQTAVMPNKPADTPTQPSFVAKTGERAAIQLEGRAGRVKLDYSVAQRGPIQAGVPQQG